MKICPLISWLEVSFAEAVQSNSNSCKEYTRDAYATVLETRRVSPEADSASARLKATLVAEKTTRGTRMLLINAASGGKPRERRYRADYTFLRMMASHPLFRSG